MTLPALTFCGAFTLAWASYFPEGLPWAFFALIAPIVWAGGLLARRAVLLSIGLVMLFTLAIAETLSDSLLPAIGTVTLGLLSWDLGVLTLRLAQAGKRPKWLLRAQALRGLAAATLGFASATGFSVLRTSIPFWGLVGMLALAWGLTAAFIRISGRLYSTGGTASGKRSSSAPIE